MPVRAVLFDIGETLVDETRLWAGWADVLGVPQLTLMGVLGAVIERDEHHTRVFELLRPGLDPAAAEAERQATGVPPRFGPGDLYPDALPCLAAVRAAGYRIGLAGNSSAWVEEFVREHVPGGDAISSSASIGVEKPDPRSYTALCERLGVAPAEAVYVGDRLDNDVLGAQRAGLRGVHLRRGPWGHIHALRPERAHADARLDGLDELPATLSALG